MVEQVLGDGGVVRVLGGARFSTASAREGSGEGESEHVSARGGVRGLRYRVPAHCGEGPTLASGCHVAAYLCPWSAMTQHDAAFISAR